MTDHRADLHAKVDQLSDPEVAVLNRFADALLTPVECWLLEDSWLTGPTWADAFLARLRAHHALNAEPLSTTAFEAAFNQASDDAGWGVEAATSATNRFFDTVIQLPGYEPMSISLKASAARGMQPDWVHISKLTEAAWVQDTRRQADRLHELQTLFAEYRANTDSIIILRCFPHEDDALLYELVEIPTSLFAAVDFLTVQEAQASTIPIPPGQKPPDFKIRVDRSDAKITLTGIRIDVCTVHGQWIVPDLSGV